MLKINLETSIDNIAYLDYMQQQEQMKMRRRQNKYKLGDFADHTNRERAIAKKLFLNV